MKKLKAFTLIEMLIVIVIIGILAAALIPRLSKARGRANDTARKADLSQIAAALVSYQIDKWWFPDWCGTLSSTANTWDALLNAWLDSIPKDPSNAVVLSWIANITSTDKWEYGYCSILKNWQPNGGFIAMAISETEWGANYVVCSNIDASTEFTNIKKCTKFTQSNSFSCKNDFVTPDSDGNCEYKSIGQLRYIYTQ